MATVQIWAWLILLSPLCSARNVSESTLLSQVATMMSHDAATGYIGVCPVLCSYYQTQTVGFPEQMDCGVRAFDLRLKLVDGTWRYYHPAEGWDDYILKDQGIPDTMASFKSWAAAHPDELVVLYFSHIAGGDPVDLTAQINSTGVPVLDGCNPGITYSQALTAGQLATGGHILGFMNCNNDNFGLFQVSFGKIVRTVCVVISLYYPFVIPPAAFTQHSGLSQDVAWEDWEALDSATSAVVDAPTYQGGFWQVQRIWQLGATAKKMTVGVLGYGTLKNNAQSKTNQRTASQWGAKGAAVGGLWLADNVCDGGIQLSQALGTTVSAADQASCTAYCDNAQHKCNQDYECADYMNTNGCCLCKDGSGCDKHMWLGHSTYGQKCEDCSTGYDCGACPDYGFKC